MNELIDLRELLHAAADDLDLDALPAGALTGRVRRRRTARTATRSVVGVGAAGAIAFGATHLGALGGADGADTAEEAGVLDEGAVAALPSADPGACGWEVAPGQDVDGSTIVTSSTTGNLRVTVLPADTTTGGELDTAVLVGSDDEDVVAATVTGATVMVTSDGVVVARHVVDDETSADLAQQQPLYLWTSVPLEACDRPDGQGPSGALDGPLAVWVLADVQRGDDQAVLLGGDVPVTAVRGEVVGYCGEPAPQAAADSTVELTGSAQIGSVVDREFTVDAAPLDVLHTDQELEVAAPVTRAAGGLGGTRLLLTDGSGTVVSDSATSGSSLENGTDAGDDPGVGSGDRFSGWYDLPAVGQGGQLLADATTCAGDPLTTGTYQAWGVTTIAPWDPARSTGPAVGSLGEITVP